MLELLNEGQQHLRRPDGHDRGDACRRARISQGASRFGDAVICEVYLYLTWERMTVREALVHRELDEEQIDDRKRGLSFKAVEMGLDVDKNDSLESCGTAVFDEVVEESCGVLYSSIDTGRCFHGRGELTK